MCVPLSEPSKRQREIASSCESESANGTSTWKTKEQAKCEWTRGQNHKNEGLNMLVHGSDRDRVGNCWIEEEEMEREKCDRAYSRRFFSFHSYIGLHMCFNSSHLLMIFLSQAKPSTKIFQNRTQSIGKLFWGLIDINKSKQYINHVCLC